MGNVMLHGKYQGFEAFKTSNSGQMRLRDTAAGAPHLPHAVETALRQPQHQQKSAAETRQVRLLQKVLPNWPGAAMGPACLMGFNGF
jgi:hypothetical protein